MLSLAGVIYPALLQHEGPRWAKPPSEMWPPGTWGMSSHSGLQLEVGGCMPEAAGNAGEMAAERNAGAAKASPQSLAEIKPRSCHRVSSPGTKLEGWVVGWGPMPPHCSQFTRRRVLVQPRSWVAPRSPLPH